MTPRDLDPTWNAYRPEALDACLQVLGTLVKALSAQDAPRVVVIGGLVPYLLFKSEALEPLSHGPPHPGTNDVDLCIQLNVAEGDEGLYQRLQAVLDRFGFSKSEVIDEGEQRLWRWGRNIGTVTVLVEFLTQADADDSGAVAGQSGRLVANERIRDGDEIGALRIRGAHLAFLTPIQCTVEVQLLDGLGIAEVEVRVANLLAFVVLKSFAVRGRIKGKDPFDLVWVLTNWPGGPAAAARHAHSLPGADLPDVSEAIDVLEREFRTPAHNGCVRYARFTTSALADADEDEHMRLKRFAHGTVEAFTDAWRSDSR